MFKADKKKDNVTDVEFEDVKDLEAEAESVNDEETAKLEKESFKTRAMRWAKKAALVAGGFIAGGVATIAVGAIASKKDDDEESDITYLDWPKDNEETTSDEEED